MNSGRADDRIVDRLAEAAIDAGDLALIHEGRSALAALQLQLLFARLKHGLPVGRDSIDNLLSLSSAESLQ